MNKKSNIVDIISITLGSIIVAFSIHVFYSANHLVIGGVSGLAIIIDSITKGMPFHLPIWLTTTIINFPLFLLAFKFLGVKNLLKTVYATIILTITLFFIEDMPTFVTDDLVLVAVYGGIVQGLGIGLVFRCFATTGGSDTAANLLHKLFFRHISIQKIMFCIDSLVVMLGFFTFGIRKGMYALISMFVLVKIIDFLQEGLFFAKAVFIISNNDEIIADALLKGLDRGVTSFFGQGMYTKKEKNILLCVVSTREIVKVKDIVQNIDNGAFLFVADVREVLGEGFKKIS